MQVYTCVQKDICYKELAPVIGLPRWRSGKESACQCRRCGFNPWVRKIPWKRKWQPTPVLSPGESHGLADYSPQGCKELIHLSVLAASSQPIIMEAEKSYGLLSARWRFSQGRKA